MFPTLVPRVKRFLPQRIGLNMPLIHSWKENPSKLAGKEAHSSGLEKGEIMVVSMGQKQPMRRAGLLSRTAGHSAVDSRPHCWVAGPAGGWQSLQEGISWGNLCIIEHGVVGENLWEFTA